MVGCCCGGVRGCDGWSIRRREPGQEGWGFGVNVCGGMGEKLGACCWRR